MGILNESAVADARTLFETLTNSALQSARANGAYSRLARVVDGATGIAHETVIAGATPTWAEWTDEADFGGARKYSRRTPLKKYHKTLALDRVQVTQDQDGSTASLMQSFLTSNGVEYLFDKLVFDSLNSNPTGVDGVAILSDTHPYGSSTTWDNKNAGALTFASFQTEVERMMGLLDEHGEPLDLQPKVLVVGTGQRQIAKEIVGAEDRPVAVATSGSHASGTVGATQITNIYKADNWELIVTPRMSSTNWCIVDPRFPPLKLVIWRKPEPIILDDMNGEHRARKDEFLYKLEADIAADGEQPWGIAGYIA